MTSMMKSKPQNSNAALDTFPRGPANWERLIPCLPCDLSGTGGLDWLVDDVFPAGQIAVIGGPLKSFKTSIACDLAVSLTTGTNFLGHFRVPRPRSVWLITAEIGPQSLRDKLTGLAAQRQLDLAGLNALGVSQEVPALDSREDIAAVAHIIRQFRFEVVILDPLYLALGAIASEVSNLYAVGPVLHRFASTCRASGATPVIVHHAVKSKAKVKFTELADLTQSGVGEVARSWLLVGNADVHPNDEADEPASPGSYRLLLNIGGSAGHSSRWLASLTTGSGPRYHWDIRALSPCGTEAACGPPARAKGRANRSAYMEGFGKRR